MHERRVLHGLSLMYRIKKKLVLQYLIECITRNEDLHSYNIRHRNNIVSEKCKTVLRKISFFPFFSKLYNEITTKLHLNTTTSFDTFEKHLKQLLKNEHSNPNNTWN